MFSDLMFTGSYGTGAKDGRRTSFFVFAVKDLEEVRRLFAGMFVRIAVGRNSDGMLAYTLDLPDRRTNGWEIVPEPKDVPGLEEAARDADCATLVKGSGTETLSLAPFTAGLRHDWSGRESEAWRALGEGRVDEAQGVLETLSAERPDWPQALHGLGRCHRQRGDLEKAAECYRGALGLFLSSFREGFPPFAAGMLSDLGVVFKKLGDLDRAAVCLKWSLGLRPNHPEALATSAALLALAKNRGIIVDALTRMLAIGGCEDLAGNVASACGQYMGEDAGVLLAEAGKAAQGFDLTAGLRFVDPPLMPERFFAELGGGQPPPPAQKKPWWRPF